MLSLYDFSQWAYSPYKNIKGEGVLLFQSLLACCIRLDKSSVGILDKHQPPTDAQCIQINVGWINNITVDITVEITSPNILITQLISVLASSPDSQSKSCSS